MSHHLPLLGELGGDEFLHASFTSEHTRPNFLLYYYAEGKCFWIFFLFWVYSYYYTKLEKAWNTKEKREGQVSSR